jgi:serine/threonine-protein kinase RsbW
MTIEREMAKQAHLDNLSALREFVEECCEAARLDIGLRYDLILAVDEVCTNVVTHGYKEMPPGPITLKFVANGENVIITISDRGRPFDPTAAPEPDMQIDWKERRVGGLGIYLLKQIADKVDYRTDDQKVNHLTIVKRYQVQDAGAAHRPENSSKHGK